jgi:hypothetical protein
LSETHVINDEKAWFGPSFETLGVSLIGEASVQVIEQVDATRVADGHLLLAGAKTEGFEYVAFACTGLARDNGRRRRTKSRRQDDEEVLVEGGLEVQSKASKCLALKHAAHRNRRAMRFRLVVDLGSEHMLEHPVYLDAGEWQLSKSSRLETV